MPFRILLEEVSVLHSVGEFFDANGKSLGHEHESKMYFKDDILADEEISPAVIKLYDDGDTHTRTVIVRVDAKGKAVDDAPEPEEKVQEPVISKGGTGAHTVTPLVEEKKTTVA
jgi:hypothetical protein